MVTILKGIEVSITMLCDRIYYIFNMRRASNMLTRGSSQLCVCVSLVTLKIWTKVSTISTDMGNFLWKCQIGEEVASHANSGLYISFYM